MSEPIVSHNERLCKVEVNPKVDIRAKYFSASKEAHHRWAGEALSLTNEDAIEFLRSVGFSQIIPGTHFAPERDYAFFFGVEWMCLHNYVHRYGLNHKNNPIEAYSTRLDSFFRKAGLFEIGELSAQSIKDGVFDFHFKNTDTHYVTRDSRSVRLLSARVAVAMIPIIANWHSRTPKGARISSLNKDLISYLQKKHEQEQAIAAAEAEAKKAAELKARIAEDTLYELIKRAVVEVMSGAKIAIAAPNTNT